MDGVGFCFSVVEYCDEDARIGVEQKYMDMYKPSLNIAPNAGSLLGMKASEETKQKISVSHKGERNYWYGRGKEMPNYGKPLSEAQKELLSKMRKGDGNPMYGVTPPHAKMTPDQVREVRAMLADGMRLTEIAKIYGVSTGQISHIKQGRSYKGVV